MLYTSIENKKIKNIKKLYDKKYRDLNNEFIIEGEHLIIEANKNNVLKEVIIEDGYDMDIDMPKSFVTNSVLKYISNLDTPPKYLGICKKIESNNIGNKILILDNVQDPGNLGTIIRSSVAFNIDTIILSNDCVDLYNSKVLRATQGMLFYVNIIKCDIEDFINKIKNEDYKIYGTKVNGGKSLKSIERSSKFAIIMGNEGTGVRENILSLCDEYLYIDMNPNCESLNVGIATSIILYELDK